MSSEIDSSLLLLNVMDMVITDGVSGSRAACRDILSCVSLTRIVFDDGRPSGRADEKAHSSSSAVGAGAAGVETGVWLAKSNMDFGFAGAVCVVGDVSAAKGSAGGACCLVAAALYFWACIACCCWNSDG